MLEDLLKHNKLEFVHIFHGKNIVKSMTMSLNIENLRYFYVNICDDKADITLDITNLYP